MWAKHVHLKVYNQRRNIPRKNLKFVSEWYFCLGTTTRNISNVITTAGKEKEKSLLAYKAYT
jgi:hypothetical protein